MLNKNSETRNDPDTIGKIRPLQVFTIDTTLQHYVGIIVTHYPGQESFLKNEIKYKGMHSNGYVFWKAASPIFCNDVYLSILGTVELIQNR